MPRIFTSVLLDSTDTVKTCCSWIFTAHDKITFVTIGFDKVVIKPSKKKFLLRQWLSLQFD